MSTRVVAAALAILVTACGPSGPTVERLETKPMASLPNTADPALANDPATGDLLLAFVGGSDSAGWRLYFSRSADGGSSWSDAVAITTDPKEVHPHGEASPRLVAGPAGRVALVWPQNITVPGRQWPANRMRFARSLDGGATWSAPITINDDTTGAPIGHTFQGAAWVGDSGIVAAWLDERKAAGSSPATVHDHGESTEDDATIYTVASADFGQSWGRNTPLWGAVCPCCRITLARRPDGSAVSVWRKHYPGNVRDIVIAPVSSGHEPRRVRADNWVYPGCPHSGPALALDRAGAPRVAWYTGRPGGAGIFLARGNDRLEFAEPIALLKGEKLPTAHPAVLALADGGTMVAWDIDKKGNRALQVAYIEKDGATPASVSVPDSRGAAYPQISALKDGSAVVAWTEVAGDRFRVGLARVSSKR